MSRGNEETCQLASEDTPSPLLIYAQMLVNFILLNEDIKIYNRDPTNHHLRSLHFVYVKGILMSHILEGQGLFYVGSDWLCGKVPQSFPFFLILLQCSGNFVKPVSVHEVEFGKLLLNSSSAPLPSLQMRKLRLGLAPGSNILGGGVMPDPQPLGSSPGPVPVQLLPASYCTLAVA